MERIYAAAIAGGMGVGVFAYEGVQIIEWFGDFEVDRGFEIVVTLGIIGVILGVLVQVHGVRFKLGRTKRADLPEFTEVFTPLKRPDAPTRVELDRQRIGGTDLGPGGVGHPGGEEARDGQRSIGTPLVIIHLHAGATAHTCPQGSQSGPVCSDTCSDLCEVSPPTPRTPLYERD